MPEQQKADPSVVSVLQSIDASLKTIKSIITWWLILAVAAGVLYALMRMN